MLIFLNYLKIKFKKQDGMEVLQVLLIAGLALVLVLSVFYPAFKTFFKSVTDTITAWFTNTGSEAFK
jgi:hypothetical protein